jgi:ABC-2 type transport system permease protein
MSSAPALPASDTVDSDSQLASLWTLYLLTLRQHLHGKRWMVMALLFLLPVGLALLVRATAPNIDPLSLEFTLAFLFIPMALLPLVALIYASGILRDEQEDQTITYLLIRPIPKRAIYTVKLLATITTTVVLTAIFTVCTYAAIYFGSNATAGVAASRCFKAICIHSLAMIAYCSLFGLMSLLLKRVLIAGVVYIALIEGILSFLPFGVRLLTIIYYTRLLAHRMLGFVVIMPNGRSEDFSDEVWQLNAAVDPQLISHPQNSTAIIILLTVSAVCILVAARMCSRREFHVKTPENE